MGVIREGFNSIVHVIGISGRRGRCSFNVVDYETGEEIRNILSMDIHIDGKGYNTCEITYHELSSNGPYPAFPVDKKVSIDCFDMTNALLEVTKETTEKEETVNTEIDDNAAFDIMDDIRKERQ